MKLCTDVAAPTWCAIGCRVTWAGFPDRVGVVEWTRYRDLVRRGGPMGWCALVRFDVEGIGPVWLPVDELGAAS